MSGSETAHRARRMGCDELHEIAPELALGTLDEATRAEACVHIDGCTDCHAEVTQLQRMTASLLLLAPEASPPAGFEGRVLNRIARFDGADAASLSASSGASAHVPKARRATQRVRRRILATAALLIVIVGVAVTAWAAFSPGSESPSLAAADMRTDGGDVVGEAVLYDGETPALGLDLSGWREGWERYGGGRDTDWLLTVEGQDGQRNSYLVALDDWTARVSLGDVDAEALAVVSVVDAHDGRVWCSGSFT